MSTFIELASRQVARFLPFRRVTPSKSAVSPVWPAAPLATSSSAASAALPRRRSFAEIIAQSRPAEPPVVTARASATPTRPAAVIGAAEGSFGSPIRKFAPLAAARPAPARPQPRQIRDFSHLDDIAVQPAQGPRTPAQPNSAYSKMWQKAFRAAIGAERLAIYRTDSKTSAMWQKAFRRALGEQSR
jgi:hypothetical protein